MHQSKLIQWLYENRKIKEIYRINIKDGILQINDPMCIGVQREDLKQIMEDKYTFTLDTRHGVITLWKDMKITQVMLC